MARWKARGRLPIRANWTFFANYHGWGAMSRYLSKFRCLKGGVSLWTQISVGKGRPPPTIFGIRKLESSLGYRMVKKIAENFNRLSRVHQRHRQTTDRQTTDGIAVAFSKRNVIRWRLLKTKLKVIKVVVTYKSLNYILFRNIPQSMSKRFSFNWATIISHFVNYVNNVSRN